VDPLALPLPSHCLACPSAVCPAPLSGSCTVAHLFCGSLSTSWLTNLVLINNIAFATAQHTSALRLPTCEYHNTQLLGLACEHESLCTHTGVHDTQKQKQSTAGSSRQIGSRVGTETNTAGLWQGIIVGRRGPYRRHSGRPNKFTGANWGVKAGQAASSRPCRLCWQRHGKRTWKEASTAPPPQHG
jgi:hypothetical protein